MESIFEQIVRHENDHTNLLRNILDRYPNAASLVLYYLLETDELPGDTSRYQYTTQSHFYGENGTSIPDIQIEGLQFRCLIEVKVSLTAPFTRAQWSGYADCFVPGSENHLCYLVPAGREDCPVRDDDLKDALGVRLHYRDWTGLIKQLRAELELRPDDVLLEAVTFWERAFAGVTMTEANLSFLSAWNGNSYIAMRKLEQTVDQARKLFDLKVDPNGGFETEADISPINEYGFYLKRGKRYELWVGIWADVDTGTPLLFGFINNRPSWRLPRPRPTPELTFKNMDLWKLGAETWGDPERLYKTVSAFRDGLIYED